MVGFIRSDLAKLKAYTPHPGGPDAGPLDRLDTNESPWDLPLPLKEKLGWLYQESLEANRYPDGSHQQLKEAIANYVQESASLAAGAITPGNISVGNGSDELIRSVLIATCLGGEGSILVANPTFSMYGILAQTLGIPVHSISRNEKDFAINLEAATATLSSTTTPPIRVIFVVHPNSPTGNLLTQPEIDWLKQLPEHYLIVIDEAYFEYSATSLLAEFLERPNWVILRTFSKAFRLASHRLGYAIAPLPLINALEKVRLPYNLPGFSQWAALLTLGERQEILAPVQTIVQERERLYQALKQDGRWLLYKSAANFLYLRSSDPQQNLEEITQVLKTKGTLIRHTGPGLRITIGTEAENSRTLANLLAI